MLRYYTVIFSFFLTSLLIFSCIEDKKVVPPPPNLLEQQQMVALLIDIHILEQQVAETKLSKNIKEDSFLLYREELFLKMGIDSTSYLESHKYYMTQVDKLHEIMTAVSDSIRQMRDNAVDNPTKSSTEKEVEK